MAVVCVPAAAGSASPALASSPQARVGTAPRLLPGATVVGALPTATRIGVTVALEPRDPAALAAYATAVSTAGSSVYRRYLSVAQFAARFGPSPTQIAAVEASLRGHGLTPGPVSANGLAIGISATAGRLAQAFSTSFERVAVPGGRTAFANTSAPALDASVAGDVQGVVGLDSLALPKPLGLRTSAGLGVRPSAAHAVGRAAPHVVTGGPQPCAAAQAAAPKGGGPGETAYTADQIASAYRYPSLYAAGDLGAGQTVAIFELEGNFASDITGFQACFGTSASVTYRSVDNGPPAPAAGSDGIESELDIETVIGLAPRANIIVYQAPNNSDQNLLDVYTAMISENMAKVISTSWGGCESGWSLATIDAENTLFQEAATQGQTVVAAAGDAGSEDCYHPFPPAPDFDKSLQVDDPASQPFVTSAGGADLQALGPPPTQTVWNDSGLGDGAGGGGISSLWPMPTYQLGAPASLNVINGNSSQTPCTAHVAAGSYCREVPDVSAATSAGGESAVYVRQSNNVAAWIGVWGTSWAAPQWAAFAALVNASSACHGLPIGFANPALYRVGASNAYASAFTDVTTGNNDYTTSGNTSGLYPAGIGYDIATGLGTPIASTLAGDLCDQVTVGNPGAQLSFVGAPVSLPVTGTSTGGATLNYTATGLPAGLAIDPATGVVSGSPSAAGTSNATVSVTSSDGLSGSTSFAWSVSATTVAVAGVGSQAGTVGIPVPALQIHAADNNARALTYTAAGLPAGLSIGAASGLITGTPTRAGSSTVIVTATDATGPSATSTFRWAIAAAASFSHGSLSGMRRGKPKLSFTMAAATGAPSIKTIVIGLPKGLAFAGKTKKLSQGIGVKDPGGKRVKFTAQVSHGELTIKLVTAESSVGVTISHTELSESKGLENRVKHGHVRSLSILVQASNAGNTTTGVVAKLGV
ncbi:MAG: putative Ig domain-containing protein [Actinomycetota bacterium]|nr:putative Ig domain-containing protein [Actinomycetota bacterium]